MNKVKRVSKQKKKKADEFQFQEFALHAITNNKHH